jgi:PAS domain S-box-containing protein
MTSLRQASSLRTWFSAANPPAQRVARISSGIAILVGCLVLVGWTLDIAVLKSILPGLATMKANTALCFILAGVSLGLRSRTRSRAFIPQLASGCAIAISAIGLLTLSQYFLGWDLGIDQLLVQDTPISPATLYPGRMGNNTALNFVLIGFALWLTGRKIRYGSAIAQAAAICAIAIALLALVGYAYHVEVFHRFIFYSSSMAIHTALSFLVVGSGILALRPERGLLKALTQPLMGSLTAQRLMPLAIAVPLVLGWVVLQGFRNNLYNGAFSLALLVMGLIGVLVAVIWKNADNLNQTDLNRKRSDERLRSSEAQLDLAMRSAQMGYWNLNLITHEAHWSSRGLELLGLPPDFTDCSSDVLTTIVHPDDRASCSQAITAAIESGGDYQHEFRVVWADGSVHWLADRGQVFYDESGQAVRIMGVAFDITDRKQAQLNEQFLNTLDLRLRQLLDADAMALEVVRSVGEYLNVNRAVWNEIEQEAELAIVKQDWYQQPEMLSIVGTYRLSDFAQPELLKLYHAGQPIIVADVATHPHTAALIENYIPYGVSAYVAAPCVIGGTWVALLAVNSKTPRNWRSDEVALLQETVARFWSIIEQTRSMQALREQEERTRLATQAADLGMWFWNLTTDELVWTDRCKAMFGIAPTIEMTYEVFLNALHPDDRDRTHTAVTRALEEQVEYDIEYRTVWSDSSIHWIAAKGRGFYDAAGQPVRMMGTAQDISDRKQVEESLRQLSAELNQQVQRFDAVISAIPDFIYTFDLEGRFRYVNQPLLDLWQRTFEESVGKNLYELDYPLELADRLQRQMQQVMTTRQPLRDETPYTSAFGTRAYEYIIVPMLDEDGSVKGIAGTTRDITDRKQAEQALRENEQRFVTLSQASPITIFQFDANSACIYINPRWTEMTGYSAEAALGMGWVETLHPDDRDRLTQEWLQWSQTAQSQDLYQNEGRIVRSDGSKMWYSIEALPVVDANNSVTGYIGTLSDITDRKQAEIALQQQTKELTELNRLKDEFLAALSHELRTPLNPILGWITMMQAQRLTPEKTVEALEIIDRNVRQQIRLVDDLLEISRVVQGKLKLELRSMDLVTTLQNAIDTVQGAAQAKAMTLELRGLASLPLIADGDRLQQVFWNLLSNAIKFTPVGGRVTVDLSAIGETNRYAQVRITDTGVGIAPDFLPHVFERFRQADGSSTRNYGGLGLGLSIVQQLVELHGGKVTVASPGLDQGATFTVLLPIREALTHPVPTADLNLSTFNLSTSGQPALDQTQFDSTPALTGIRILALDDDPDNLDLLGFLLEQEAAVVTAVSSPRSAIELITHQSFDLIISDIGMPELDGYQFIQQIRALPQGRSIPALALTAFVYREDQEKAIEAGFQAYISKPVNPIELLERVTQLVNR